MKSAIVTGEVMIVGMPAVWNSGRWLPKKLIVDTAISGCLAISSLAQRCDSSGEIAIRQTSSLIGRPGLPFWMSAPQPPSSSLMYLTAASAPSVASGKLPFGSPSGFSKPMTIGSPTAFSGVASAQVRSDMNRPAPVPSAASIELSIAGQPALPVPVPVGAAEPAVVPPLAAVVAAPAVVAAAAVVADAAVLAVVDFVSPSLPHAAAIRAAAQASAPAFHTVRVLIGLPPN